MSTEVLEAKSRAELSELALQSGVSVVGKSGGLFQEKQSARQVGASKMCATRKLSVKLNYVLDLSDYTGMSNMLSNTCIAQCLL